VGYDAGKRIKGRKIHALVDSEGLPMRVLVHSAAIQDRDGAGLVLDKIRRRFPWLELIWADGGYNAWQVDAAVAKVPRLRLAIVKRCDTMKGFAVLPRRWVVERTFSWFGRNRRLAKDFENLAETLATFSPSPASSLPSGALLGRSRCQARAPAVSLVSGPWAKRAATTRMRRFWTFPPLLRNGEVRPKAVARDLAGGLVRRQESGHSR
jgi:transposase